MSFESVKKALANYEDLLNFEEVGEVIKIIPKHYLPKPKWEEINLQVKELGGRYVGGIKETHWVIEKKAGEKPTPQLTLFGRLELVKNELEAIIKTVKEAEH